jgi:nucleosome-remodeling factor subunit BPTF
VATRFYIGCERCQDWFHGHCVGVLPGEADHIDEYTCPNCDSTSRLNQANFKQLTEDDNEMMKKLCKQLIVSDFQED